MSQICGITDFLETLRALFVWNRTGSMSQKSLFGWNVLFAALILETKYCYYELKQEWDELHLADNQKCSAGVDKSISGTFGVWAFIFQGHLRIAAGLYRLHVRVIYSSLSKGIS